MPTPVRKAGIIIGLNAIASFAQASQNPTLDLDMPEVYSCAGTSVVWRGGLEHVCDIDAWIQLAPNPGKQFTEHPWQALSAFFGAWLAVKALDDNALLSTHCWLLMKMCCWLVNPVV